MGEINMLFYDVIFAAETDLSSSQRMAFKRRVKR